MTRSGAFDAVFFDCDSTLSRVEGIDELARRIGVEDEIAPLTAAAMSGRLPLDAVYAERLAIVRPDRAAVAWLGGRYIEEMVPGARETVSTLHALGKAVYILSGGLQQALEQIARALCIPFERVHAVPLHFDRSGSYCGFDTSSPLCRAEGKAVLCRELGARYRSIAMVGDGMTDLAAQSAGAYVVGFGGVARREAVAQGADRFVTEPDLTATLEALLTEEERRAVPTSPRRAQ